MPTELLFQDPPYAGQPINLVFGGSGSVVASPAFVTVYITHPAPVFSAIAAYDNRVTRWRDQRVGVGFDVGLPRLRQQDSSWGLSAKELGGTHLGWGQAERKAGQVGVRLAIADQRASERDLAHQQAFGLIVTATSTVQVATQHEQVASLLWQQSLVKSDTRVSVMETATRHRNELLAEWHLPLLRAYQRTNLFGAASTLHTLAQIMPWERARQAANGKEAWPPIVVPPIYYTPDNNLLFQCPPLTAPWLLRFGDKPCYLSGPLASLFILPSRFYMTINTVVAVLLPSLADVPLYSGATISQDIGSYGWTLSATGPDTLYEQLKPLPGQPKRIRVTINGIAWVFDIDHPAKSHSFGKKVTSITGRSVTAALGPAFSLETARMNASPFTAQQLAALALENTGVSLDWGIDDWLVPTGAWSHYGTPLAAVQAIAQAAGGYIQSARSAAVLQVRHPYPQLPGGVTGGPWNWFGGFAPDVSLAPDAIIKCSEELRDSPVINAVYISGTTQGVLALVKREGTAGDLLASQVNDVLITDNAAARQRGLAVIAASGGRIMRRLELPVLVGPGQPGVLGTDQLIEVTDSTPWRGRVRAVSVTANGPSARQDVLVEVA